MLVSSRHWHALSSTAFFSWVLLIDFQCEKYTKKPEFSSSLCRQRSTENKNTHGWAIDNLTLLNKRVLLGICRYFRLNFWNEWRSTKIMWFFENWTISFSLWFNQTRILSNNYTSFNVSEQFSFLVNFRFFLYFWENFLNFRIFLVFAKMSSISHFWWKIRAFVRMSSIFFVAGKLFISFLLERVYERASVCEIEWIVWTIVL